MLGKGIYQLQKTLGLGEKYYREEEDETRILIVLAVPGATTTKSFKIKMTKERLKVVFEGNDFCSSFLYVYPLTDDADRKESSAELEDGLLTIIIPKY